MGIPAVILAGGRSRRMGRDKATIEINGTAMIVRVLRSLKQAGCKKFLIQVHTLDDVARLSPLLNDFTVDWGLDDEGIRGVLGALHCALCSAENYGWECVQLAPVDTPFAQPELFHGLAELLKDGWDAVVPSTESAQNSPSEGCEPLLSCLRVAPAIKAIEGISESDDRRLAKMIDTMKCIIINQKQWSSWGVQQSSFKNFNLSEDIT